MVLYCLNEVLIIVILLVYFLSLDNQYYLVSFDNKYHIDAPIILIIPFSQQIFWF